MKNVCLVSSILVTLFYSKLSEAFSFDVIFGDESRVKKARAYDFHTCKKYEGEEREYYLTCNESGNTSESELKVIVNDTSAILKKGASEDLLETLKGSTLERLRLGLKDNDALSNCIRNKDTSSLCESIRMSTIDVVRSEMPRLRILMAQMSRSGHIYSPTKPERFNRKLEHEYSSNIEPPGLSNRETLFLIEHTDMLESQFSQLVMSNDEIEGLDDCIKNSGERLELKKEKRCNRYHPIIANRVNNYFDKQNKKYKEAYDDIISKNPILSLLSLRGDESDKKILSTILEQLDKINESTLKTIEFVESLEGDKRKELMAFTQGVDAYLQQHDSLEIYCDLAQELRDDLDLSRLGEDIFIGASALVGGGVCAFSGGLACALGVGISTTAAEIGLNDWRLRNSNSILLTGLGDLSRVSENSKAKDLALFLSPLAIIGTGVGKGINGAVSKVFIKSPKEILDLNIARSLDSYRLDVPVEEVLLNARLVSDLERIKVINHYFPNMNDDQVKAVVKAHHVNGDGVYLYTHSQLSKKIEIMKKAGLSHEDIRATLRLGLSGKAPKVDSLVGKKVSLILNDGITFRPKKVYVEKIEDNFVYLRVLSSGTELKKIQLNDFLRSIHRNDLRDDFVDKVEPSMGHTKRKRQEQFDNDSSRESASSEKSNKNTYQSDKEKSQSHSEKRTSSDRNYAGYKKKSSSVKKDDLEKGKIVETKESLEIKAQSKLILLPSQALSQISQERYIGRKYPGLSEKEKNVELAKEIIHRMVGRNDNIIYKKEIKRLLAKVHPDKFQANESTKVASNKETNLLLKLRDLLK